MVKKIGIDLGTTNTVVSYIENGKFKYLYFNAKDSLPSAILYRNNKIDVGEKAVKRSVIHSEQFIKSSKTFMGDHEKEWNIEGKKYTPTEVATEILIKVKNEAQKVFADEQLEAVITVPAYFNSNQREETKKAGENAGFIVKQIINEPVAAAVAYGFEDDINGQIFVVDIGGGTFDVSILKVLPGEFESVAIEGNSKLGGDDFDQIILEKLYKEIRMSTGVDLESFDSAGLSKEEYTQACQKLVIEAEEAKKTLSSINRVEIDIPALFVLKGAPYNFSTVMSRDEFEEEAKSLFTRIKRTIRKCLDDANISPSEIDKVILVGGTSNIPIIKEFVEEEFGKKPYADRDLAKLVAMGAALVADSDDDSIILRDIIAHSLGIEIEGQRFEKILLKNMRYPTKQSKLFTTTYDYQTEVDICIFEGENSENVEENTFYGSFVLPNIQKAKKGIPKIEVEFAFDNNQTLHVTAKDITSGSKNSMSLSLEKGIRKERKQAHPNDIALLLDRSGSMSGSDIIEAKKACLALVNSMIDFSINRVGFITFDTHSNILSPLTNDKNKLIREIQDIHVTGSTNMAAAFENADKVLRDSKNSKIVIMVTDGAPDNASSAVTNANKLKINGIRIITIGVGSGVNSGYLMELASNPEDYYFVTNMNQLQDIFEKITNSLQAV